MKWVPQEDNKAFNHSKIAVVKKGNTWNGFHKKAFPERD